jgi:hypothetical protein
VSTSGTATRQCDYCKEDIKVDAVRCKHCQATLILAAPTHGGACPYCKEAIMVDAVRCKHCKANLAPGAVFGPEHEGLAAPLRAGSIHLVVPHRAKPSAMGSSDSASVTAATCPQSMTLNIGGQIYVLVLIEETATTCVYENQGLV